MNDGAFNQYGQREQADRLEVRPPIEVEAATWSDARRALKVIDLARVKINQSSRVRRLISAAYRVLRPLAGQAWWPSSHWFRSRDFMRSVKARQVVAVPFLQRVTGESVTGAAALIGQHRDLVHQVWMLRPAGRNGCRPAPRVGAATAHPQIVDLFRTTGRGCEWTGSYGSWTVNSV
jgi:hypothetical protein